MLKKYIYKCTIIGGHVKNVIVIDMLKMEIFIVECISPLEAFPVNAGHRYDETERLLFVFML